jgi:broad-specificity NMP kinase
MKRSIWIIGIPGSGKSALYKALQKRGYEAYDIETGHGLFSMVDDRTGKPVENLSNENVDQLDNSKWVCDKEKLAALIQHQTSDLAFYCGVASNSEELWPLFDRVMLLQASPENTRARLSTRKKGDFGATREVQDWVLSWKDWWEQKLLKRGAILVDANLPVDVVADNILKKY